MSQKERLNIFPSRGSLLYINGRLSGANKGHSLLRKKSDALQVRFRLITSEIVYVKESVSQLAKEAMFSLAEAKFASGDFTQQVLADVDTAHTRVSLHREWVGGVSLPIFTCLQDGGDSYQLTCLATGGQRLRPIKENFRKLASLLVELASLQSAFITLNAVIKSINQRVNALEFVLIPRLERTIAYIHTELDEVEREEFYRLKKVQRKKKEEQRKMDARKALKAAAAIASSILDDGDQEILF